MIFTSNLLCGRVHLSHSSFILHDISNTCFAIPIETFVKLSSILIHLDLFLSKYLIYCLFFSVQYALNIYANLLLYFFNC